MKIALLSCAILFSIVACSTFNSETSLTLKEQSTLIDFSRNVILSNPNLRLSANDIYIVETTKPKIDIKYSGYKSGLFNISWNFSNMTINCLGRGDLTNPSKSFTGITTISTSEK